MIRIFFILVVPFILFAREWTALIYMAADNGLAQWADSDLVEMQEIGSNDDLTILVQIDKPTIGAKRLLVSKGTSYELQDLGVIDMCDWQTLADFLEWGITSYPAERYFISLWDHGTGWTLTLKRSFGSDWSSGNQMSISNGDFQKAISTAYHYTGIKIHLFAFDACLMQQIEVAFEIKDYARILVAPQTVCPLQGFRYDKIFEKIYENPEIKEGELAKDIVKATVENYVDVQPVVYSAINLAKLGILKQTSNKLITSLMMNSPSRSISNLREDVQTIPVAENVPYPDDEHIDMGDFVKRLSEIMSSYEIAQVLAMYNSAIIESGYWGENFAKTTGLSIWFPLHYKQFKQLLNNYISLTWAQSKWLQFLNWFYNEDDIRPASIDNISISSIGQNNDFRLHWSRANDLAPVLYNVLEIEDTMTIFEDQCEDTNKWYFDGFTLNSNNSHSGNYSFFSGNTSNLRNSMETKEPLLIENIGILSIYLYYNTEDITDSLIIEYGPFKDIHYGRSNGWQERSVVLPSGMHKLKISYYTNSSINIGGCYIDDIQISTVNNGRYIRHDCSDTTLYIFNKLRGGYNYVVFPEDKYCNLGNMSNWIWLFVEDFAIPYSNPNPFQTTCYILLDYPDSLNPTVEIFSIFGRKIIKFGPESIHNKTIYWNGKDSNNQDVGSGLYFVLLKDGSFKKLGKIARQR